MSLLVSRKELEGLLCLSRSAVSRLTLDPTFPEPVELGSRSVRWVRAEVEAWVLSRPRKSRPVSYLPKDLVDPPSIVLVDVA